MTAGSIQIILYGRIFYLNRFRWHSGNVRIMLLYIWQIKITSHKIVGFLIVGLRRIIWAS